MAAAVVVAMATAWQQCVSRRLDISARSVLRYRASQATYHGVDRVAEKRVDKNKNNKAKCELAFQRRYA